MRFLTKRKSEQYNSNSLDRFRQKSRAKWWWRFLGLIVVGLMVWYGANIFIALKRVTTPNTSSSSVLKDTNKQSAKPINVLLIGVGGAGHPGGTLADSIMVASIDPKHDAVSLLSIPRDLYVTIPGAGKQKINAAHSIGEQSPSKGGGPALMKEVVADTLDVPIHYFIRIDFDGFKKIVDTLGGVTVDVKTPISDPFFPDAQLKGYEPFSISKGVHKLDGKTALKYARSRETTSDFDRARRQQEVIIAIKDKVLTPQTLANPKKVTDLISTIGRHLLTDFSPSEIEDLIKLAKDLENPTINRQVIGNGDAGLVMSSRASNGASILIPKAGMNDFSQIQIFTQAFFAAPAIQSEKPTIRLDRAGASKDMVLKVTKQLETAGFTVLATDEALPSSAKTSLTDTTKGKKVQSLTFLTTAYNVETSEATNQSVTHDFVLTLGTDFASLIKSAPAASTQKKTSKTQENSNEKALTSQAAVPQQRHTKAAPSKATPRL